MALTAWHLRPHADAFAEVVSRLHCAQNMSKDTGKDKARYYACMQALRYINALRKAGSLPYEELKGLMITTSDDGSLFTNMSTAIVHARSALMQTARFADLPNGYTFVSSSASMNTRSTLTSSSALFGLRAACIPTRRSNFGRTLSKTA